MNARSARPIATRLAALLPVAALLLVTGCVTYSQSWHGVDGSGLYYGESGHGGYGQPAPAASGNPSLYPYWSLDHFYFSSFHHPYSAYVGYAEPLYYPYPGWALAHPYSHRAGFGHGAGFGYPWHGVHDRYAYWSFGFFARHSGRDHHRRDRHHHPREPRHGTDDSHQRLRAIDRRLAGLEHATRDFDRRALLGRDRIFAERRAAGGFSAGSSLRPGARSRARDVRSQRPTEAPVRRALRGTQSRDVDRNVPPAATSQRDRIRGERQQRSAARRTRSAETSRREIRQGIPQGIPIGDLRGRVVVSGQEADRGSKRPRGEQRSGAVRVYQGRADRARVSGAVPERAPARARGQSSPERSALIVDRSPRPSEPVRGQRRDRGQPAPRAQRSAPSAPPPVRSAPAPAPDRADATDSSGSRRALLRAGNRSRDDDGGDGRRRRR